MGIFKYIQSIFKLPAKETDSLSLIIEKTIDEYTSKNQYYWWLKGKDFLTFNQKVLTLDDKEKVGFILHCVQTIYRYYNQSNYLASRNEFMRAWVCEIYMEQLLKMHLNLDDEDISKIINEFKKYPRQSWNQHITCWPVDLLLNQIEYQLTLRPCTQAIKSALLLLNNEILKDATTSQQKQQKKIFQKLYELQFKLNNTADIVQSRYFLIDDEFVKFANHLVKDLVEEEQSLWFRLMYHAENSQLEKPTADFLAQGRRLIDALGFEKFSNIVNNWFIYVIRKRKKDNRKKHPPHAHFVLLNPCNLNMLKGFVWMCGCYPDKTTLKYIAELARVLLERNTRKPYTITALTIACLYTLSRSATMHAVTFLSALKNRIKETEIQGLVNQYLEEAASLRQIPLADLEDMAVPDFDINEGIVRHSFPPYHAELTVNAKCRVELQWLNEDGKKQKHIPAVLKEKYSEALTNLQENAREISGWVRLVIERLDRMPRSGRLLSWQHFNDCYINHPLVSYFAKRMIWCFQYEQKSVTVFYLDGKWVTHNGEQADLPAESPAVSLWHPLNSPVEEILAWRNFLTALDIKQPVKQAFREVFIVAEQELKTRLYSNRMAAHLIKQQQFKMLANLKGWKYTPFGNDHDGRYKEIAVLSLPDYKLKAEFCINEPAKENEVYGKHMWQYVGTDQVRFVNQHGERVALNQVPKIVFSEAMRDIHFFIKETAIGKDLEWVDGGGVRGSRKNWQTYFRESTESTAPRKMILERVLPRLKTGDRMELKDNTLVVKGKLRTYYIDLRSTRICMSPYNQTLCIQPLLSAKTESKVYLPFEGDYGLSIIISQALLLAEDDKITDAVINRQIKVR
jgi:hypothetical protein